MHIKSKENHPKRLDGNIPVSSRNQLTVLGYVSFVRSNCWTDVSLVGVTGLLHPGEGLHFHAFVVPDKVFLCQDTIDAFVNRWPFQIRLKLEVG